MSKRSFTVIGGGPAGLTAAYELTKHGFMPVVLEKDPIVGGIARTENYKGYHFDMGGHRFFTKVQDVNAMWQEVLADEFLKRPRLSRIFYKKRFFYYPLKPLDALLGLGIWEGLLIILSYIRWQIWPATATPKCIWDRRWPPTARMSSSPARQPSASEKQHHGGGAIGCPSDCSGQ